MTRRDQNDVAGVFKEKPKVALAFSGGVDSAYLLYAARKCGAQVCAYYVRTALQPLCERSDARRLAELLGADVREAGLFTWEKPAYACLAARISTGASFGGVSALLSMVNSCASGISVVNIDNGFGAGYLAGMINHVTARK